METQTRQIIVDKFEAIKQIHESNTLAKRRECRLIMTAYVEALMNFDIIDDNEFDEIWHKLMKWESHPSWVTSLFPREVQA